MKRQACTIFDCEYQRFIPGIIIGHKVFALDDNNSPTPASKYICHVRLVQFFIGTYDLENKIHNAKWGYFEVSDGEIALPPMYDHAGTFYGDRARVRLKNKYGFIDSSFNIVAKIIWDECYGFTYGLSRVRRGFLWGFIDTNGKFVARPRFESAEDYICTNGGRVAALVKKDGKYGFLDSEGRYIVEPNYDDAKPFWYKGYAPVNIRGVWGFIDDKGEYAVPFQFDDVSLDNAFSEFYLVQKGGVWGVMDENLSIAMPEESPRYVISGDKKVYLGDGYITSVRKARK